MIPRLKKTKEEKSKLKVKKRKAKYFWEIEKEGKPSRVVDWSKYIKVKVPVIPIKYTSFKGEVFSGSGGRKYGFARVVKIRKSNRKHTAHLLRLSTERQLAPRPAMILSSEDYSFEQAMERIKDMHSKQGKQKIAYLEIYCCYESESLLREYIKELSEKFKSEVFAVIHDDESVPHCHILVAWKNKEGKAIRLKRGDFKRLWATTIQRLQPSRLLPQKKGEGLPRTPYWVYRKAWLQDYDTYAQFCFDQWRQWELFYQWLNEYNWDIEPPFRRRFFKTWLWQEGYEPQPEEIEEVNPFEILKELTSRLEGLNRLEAPPQGDMHADVKQAEDKQAEGLRNFTTTLEGALEKNEVVIGGGVDAQQLVVVPEVGIEEDKEVNPEVMVVATEKTEDIKEPVMEATMEEPKELLEPIVVAKEEVSQEGTKLEDRKDEVVATRGEPLEGPKDKEDRKDEVLAKKEPEGKEDKKLQLEDKKEDKVVEPKKEERKDKKEPVMVASRKLQKEDRKDEVVAMMVAKEPKEEDRKETKESKVVVANIKTEDKEENRKEKLVMVAIEDKKEIEDRKELDMVAKEDIKEPKEDKDKKKPDIVLAKEWGVEDLWAFIKEKERAKRKQIRELEKAIFRSFSQVKSSRRRGAK